MNIFEQWGWSWTTWYKGDRGEYWFLAQIILIIGFSVLPTQPIVPQQLLPPTAKIVTIAMAGILGTAALLLLGKGLLDLGRSLTPLPYPREDGTLVTTGVYGLVRHPLYTGIIFAALGWTLFTLSWLHLLGLGAIAGLLNHKATLEEQWLAQKYPNYSVYQSQVKKLIPWLW